MRMCLGIPGRAQCRSDRRDEGSFVLTPAPERSRRCRATESAQAIIETAFVIPILLFMVCGFVALMLEVEAQQELDAATKLAAESTFQAPLERVDPPGRNCCSVNALGVAVGTPLNTSGLPTACRYAGETFYGTMTFAPGFIAFNQVPFCGPQTGAQGRVLANVGCNLHAIDPAVPNGGRVVICRSSATLLFSKTPIGWAIAWNPTLTSSAEAVPPPFREKQLP